MVLDLSYQYRCIASLQFSVIKPRQTIKFSLSRSSFAQMLINLFADFAYLSVKQIFEFWKQSKLKRRDISYKWCYQILYTCTMYVQGKRNTCNMLRSFKQKQRKVWTSSHKIYQAKIILLAFDIKTWRNCALFSQDASDQRDSCGCIVPTTSISSYLANISLQYKLLGTLRELLNASVL